jgi:hypothetical protein
VLPRADEGASKRSHRQHLVDERFERHSILDPLLINEIRNQWIHGGSNGALEAREAENKHQNHLRVPLLYQNETRCYRFPEPRVRLAFVFLPCGPLDGLIEFN